MDGNVVRHVNVSMELYVRLQLDVVYVHRDLLAINVNDDVQMEHGEHRVYSNVIAQNILAMQQRVPVSVRWEDMVHNALANVDLVDMESIVYHIVSVTMELCVI